MKRTLKGKGETVTSKLNVHFIFVCIFTHITQATGDVGMIVMSEYLLEFGRG